jgi:hypothetical protein
MIHIETLRDATEAALKDINRLLMQLRSDSTEPAGTLDDLRTMVADDNVALIVAKRREKNNWNGNALSFYEIRQT